MNTTQQGFIDRTTSAITALQTREAGQREQLRGRIAQTMNSVTACHARLTELQTMNRCFQAGGDKGLTYSLWNSYLKTHPHSSVAEPVRFERIFDRLITYRVRVEQRANNSKGTIPPVVHVELGMPGSKDIVVAPEPLLRPSDVLERGRQLERVFAELLAHDLDSALLVDERFGVAAGAR